MSGIDRVLVDTNIFIYLFEGKKYAADALQNKEIYFSFVTEIELLGNSKVDASAEKIIKNFLSEHNKYSYNASLEKRTIEIKKKYKIKIPDALIAATAIEYNLPLLTSDKDFNNIPNLQCILFEV